MQTISFDLVKERHAELLREAENERLARRLPDRRSGAHRFRESMSSWFGLSSRTRPADERPAGIEVRWGTPEDEARVSDLLDLNGVPRPADADGGYIVAERGGKVLAAVPYRMEPKRLLLGLPLADPWAEERPLARALYTDARELAREVGARKVRARSYRR